MNNKTEQALDNLKERLTEENKRIRTNILNNVTPALAKQLQKDEWFMQDSYFGCGVYSNGIDDDDKLIEGRCYTELEKMMRKQGMTTKEIVCEFSRAYLRQYGMYDFINKHNFKYI